MTMATSAPTVTHLKPGSLAFGDAWKSTENMSTTTTNRTGHLAMFQIVCAVEPIPSGPATALTTGPVSTTASSTVASRMIITSVIRICSGLSFQNGRPSGVS